MNRPLILVGGGGHCKSVIEAAESAGFEIRGVLDLPECLGQKILDTEVIGNDDDIPNYVDDCDFVVTMGFIKDPAKRINLHKRIAEARGRLATVIASTARVSKYARIGEGTVVLHGAVINADAKIGRGCIINTLADIEHDADIGDYSHVSTCASVNGETKVGQAVFIGSNAAIGNCLVICDNAIIGAGSVVLRNIKEPGIYAGNPCRKI